MRSERASRGILLCALSAVIGLAPATWGQSAENALYHAYYLEHARGDFAAAAAAYAAILADRQADAELKAAARIRRAICREELASADFARLMPPNALLYAELNRPGQQASRLLEMLGLLGGQPEPAGRTPQRFAISPALVRGLLGIRGAAVAITGFDMARQVPTGVAVLHPGDLTVIRGLLETALPAAAEPVEPIGGFATWRIEGRAFVTLTNRLAILSGQREETADVIARLSGQQSDSLADSPELAEVLAQRDDSLLFFCVNFKPVMPLLNATLAAAGTQSRELAVAQALLDLNSLRTLVGRAGVDADGVYLDLTLRLDEAHRNLVFHFFRMPPIEREALQRVPDQAAGFLVMALNEAGRQPPPPAPVGDPARPISMLDIGRELFANVVSFAAFALPTEQHGAPGACIPPVAAVITVNDPARSQAFWSELLGVASVASGAGTLDGLPERIGGIEARRYVFPDDVSVYLALVDRDVLISPSRQVLSRTLTTLRGGASVLDDPVFGGPLRRVGPSTTLALLVHPGRCARLAGRFLPPTEVARMQPVIEVLTETVGSVVMEHSEQMFRFSAAVSGLPDVGPLVSRLIAEQRRRTAADLVPGVPLGPAATGRETGQVRELETADRPPTREREPDRQNEPGKPVEQL